MPCAIRGHQAAGLGGGDKVGRGGSWRSRRTCQLHVQAHRDRALVEVEHLLELGDMIAAARSCCTPSGWPDPSAEQREAVDVVGVGSWPCPARRRTGKSLPAPCRRRGTRPWPSRPSELQTGLALDDHRGGGFQSRPGRSCRCSPSLLEGRSKPSAWSGLQASPVELHQRLLVEVGAAHADQHHAPEVVKSCQFWPPCATGMTRPSSAPRRRRTLVPGGRQQRHLRQHLRGSPTAS